jgi:hypothetical protein
MSSPCEITISPIVNKDWWNAHVIYSKFRRQGIDIICASFKHKYNYYTTNINSNNNNNNINNNNGTFTIASTATMQSTNTNTTATPIIPKANIVFITGLTESFIKYSEIIQYLFEQGFNVFTYDHQSQGLSGRC